MLSGYLDLSQKLLLLRIRAIAAVQDLFSRFSLNFDDWKYRQITVFNI
ncbi:hypothetical protein MTR67_022451 [Solanum verrucosum]|uniref:Uncharacterized protein n=1 Tax=Solanum verrucosum TaxID=315347 RepID=A0AAF0QYZ1_SOLVR|nr:hypothetical protein MTR67_022451 [Solanum verrucosum]